MFLYLVRWLLLTNATGHTADVSQGLSRWEAVKSHKATIWFWQLGEYSTAYSADRPVKQTTGGPFQASNTKEAVMHVCRQRLNSGDYKPIKADFTQLYTST